MNNIAAREVRLSAKILGAPLTNSLFFFSVAVSGCAYIVYGKLHGHPQEQITFVPVAVMVGYGLLLLFAKALRLRDDQSGDNLYYMGFLFTLTSLGVSLYQFSSTSTAELIVQNFGIAIASTIAGIALRIFFNQMRRDPIEIEATARAELSDAARKVRRELESVLLEFGNFRRTVQQMTLEGLAETRDHVNEVSKTLLKSLQEVTEQSAGPLEAASKHSGDTLDELTKSVVNTLNKGAERLAAESDRLSKSAATISETLDAMSSKLASMKTPDEVIEIKLSPTIQGISRAVNSFTKSAESQTAAIQDILLGAVKATNETAALIASFKRETETRDAAIQQKLDATTSAVQNALDTAEKMRASVGNAPIMSAPVESGSARPNDSFWARFNR